MKWIRQGVVVSEDLELGAQEVVAELLSDRPLKGEELQLPTGVVGLVLLCGTQLSTCIGQDPQLPILILRQDGAQPSWLVSVPRMNALVKSANPRTGAIVLPVGVLSSAH